MVFNFAIATLSTKNTFAGKNGRLPKGVPFDKRLSLVGDS